MSGPNVYGLDPEFLALVDFEDEENPEGVKSLLDDPAMVADHMAPLEPVARIFESASMMTPEHRAELDAFIRRVAMAGKMLARDVDSLKEWRADVDRRIRMREQRYENLRAYLAWFMRAWGIDKAKDTRISVWTAKSPPSVTVEDEAAVPSAYKRVESRIEYGLIPGDVLEFLLAYTDADGETSAHARTSVEVMKAPIIEAFRETGEVPNGVSIDATRKHVVWR